jgi:hypothetical protein
VYSKIVKIYKDPLARNTWGKTSRNTPENTMRIDDGVSSS